MIGQYGLLFVVALKARAPQDRSAKAEDAYYARFGEDPLQRLMRAIRLRCPTIKPAGAEGARDADASCEAAPSAVVVRPRQARTAPSGRTPCKAA